MPPCVRAKMQSSRHRLGTFHDSAFAALRSIVLCGIAISPLGAQTVIDRRPIAADPPFDIVEAFLAIDPADGSRLLAAAMAGSTDSSLVFLSGDGGDTWRPTGPVPGAAFSGGDPMLAFGSAGTAFFTTITPRFTIWRSEDGGVTWADSTEVPGRAFDRQWVAPFVGGAYPRLVVAAGKTPRSDDVRLDDIAVTVSRDGGASFPAPTLIRPDSGYLHVVTDALVTRSGRILLPYLVHHASVPGTQALLRGRMWLLASDDGGETWDTPRNIGMTYSYSNGNWPLAARGLGVGGIAVDESGGSRDGWLYASWSQVMDERVQVVVAASGDHGEQWSDPVRVNDGGFRSNMSTPAVAVNEEGVVAVAWYDRRNDPADLCYQPFLATSRDGGRTFGPSVMVDEATGCFANDSRWINGGDTMGLVAQPGGSFRLAWINGRRGSLQLHTAVIQP